MAELEAENRRLLRTHGLEASMSRTGNPYDNAAVERLPGTAVPALRAACIATRPPAVQKP